MRIIFIGDLQYWDPAEEKLEYKMNQLSDLKPDYAFMMGDFGGRYMRRPEGYRETRGFLDMIGCDWNAVLGNHDVEYGPDNVGTFDAYAMFHEIFEREPISAKELGGVLFINVSTEPQPLEGMRSIYTVYQSDETFKWVEDQLSSHADLPVIMVTHAPLAGNGFRCCPPMHSSASDTYVDQSFDPKRWHDLPKRFPNIKAWFSAHYHMGHDYDRAMTEREGCIHVSCGAITCCSRDDSHHTRLADIEGKSVIISTFDHDTGSLYEEARFDLASGDYSGRIYPIRCREMLLGEEDRARAVWQDGDNAYISTEAGLLWEYDASYCEFSGTIMRSGNARELSVCDGRLYVRSDTEIFSVELYSRDRWEIQGAFTKPVRRPETEMKGTPLKKIPYTSFYTREGRYIRF